MLPCARSMLSPAVASRLRDLTETYRRAPKLPVQAEMVEETEDEAAR